MSSTSVCVLFEFLFNHPNFISSKVPENYKVLLMQGGGTGLFAAVALNLIGRTGSADYLVTGSWSAKAAKEATKYGKVNQVVPKPAKFTGVPSQKDWKLDPNASYVYYCDNETIEGVEFDIVPETNGVPLVVDMSSNIMSRPVDIQKVSKSCQRMMLELNDIFCDYSLE